MSDTIIRNTNGTEIHLRETNDAVKLRNQLMLLGMNGLAYSPWYRGIAEKLEKIEAKKK